MVNIIVNNDSTELFILFAFRFFSIFYFYQFQFRLINPIPVNRGLVGGLAVQIFSDSTVF